MTQGSVHDPWPKDHLLATGIKTSVTVNSVCQLDRGTECLYSLSSLICGGIVRMFGDVINV